MKPKYTRLYVLIVCALMTSQSGAVNFDTSLLAGASGEADLSRFYDNSDMPPGEHELDIYVNGDWKGRFNVNFAQQQDDIRLAWRDAALLGVRLDALPAPKDENGDITLAEVVQGGKVEVEPGTLSLRLTVPQASLDRVEAGYLPSQFWDEGISALLLSYNATYYNTHSKLDGKDTSDDLFAGIESGVNLLGWQFRDNSVWRKRAGENGSWQNNTRYVRKPIAGLGSNLMVGDFFTQGELFDSLRIRGVSLRSDLNMRPNSQRGFSPVVRGTAQTNALVRIIQNGSVIYQENVPPGAFVIDTIQPTGSAGDLFVSVLEADGSTQSFSVPFSSVPGMLKEGVSQYSLVAGNVRSMNSTYEPGFLQGTLQYGMNNLVTGYAGTILSDNYQSSLIGAGWNLPVGAVSVDVTHANTRLQQGSKSGQSFRIAYSRFIDFTGTNFTLAAYRYSTKGYYSFTDAIYSRDGYQRLRDDYENRSGGTDVLPDIDLSTWDAMRSARPKNTFTLNLNQRLGDKAGTIFFSGTQRDYWSASQTNREYQVGYSNAFGQMSYNVSASRVRNSDREEETRFYASLSVPFSMFDNRAWVTAGMSANGSKYQQSNISLSGNALESNRLSYTLSGSNQKGGENMASANLSMRTAFSTLGGSFSESSDYRQAGLSSRGSLVAIPGHILASNEIGNTLTIVEAPQAAGLMVNGDESIKTNRDGLALVPYATPYRKNAITLTQTNDSDGAEIIGNIANVVPYDGSVNMLRFETDRRQSWQLKAVRPDAKPLPFGTEVFDENRKPVGYVGQASVIYLRATEPPKMLNIPLRGGHCVIQSPALSLNQKPALCLPQE